MENLIGSTILLALFLGVRRLFDGKISARLQYAIWLLVAVRLLFAWCPLPESHLSVMNLFLWAQEAPDGQQTDASDDLALQGNAGTESGQKGEGVSEGIVLSKDAAVQDDNGAGKSSSAAVPENGNAAGEKSTGVQDSTRVAGKNNVQMILYGVGGGFIFLWMAVQNVCFWLDLRRRRILCHEELPVPWVPGKLYILEGLSSPFLFGRNIYVSPDMLEDKQKLCHILTHEICHWRQGDNFWALLRNACLIMYWFHPLVWYGAWLSKADGELSCDERAICMLGEDSRISYGETLLQLIRQQNARGNFSCLSTLMSGNKRETRKRIDRIAKGQKVAWRRVIVLGVCIFAMLALTVPGRGYSSGSSAEKNLDETVQKEESTDGGNTKESLSGTGKPEEAVQNGKRRVLEARNGQYEIYVQEGEKQKLYVYNMKTGQQDSIKVEPGKAVQIMSQIMSLEWLTPERAAVFSHLSPSTGCLSIYELETKELLCEKYCTFYAWHDNLESLVYVEPSSYYSAEYGKVKILDQKDRILYQTEKKEVVSDIAINSKGDLAVVTEKNPVEDDQPVNQILYLKKIGKKYQLAGRKKMKKGKNISQLKWLDDTRISFDVNGKKSKMAVDEM